LQRSALGRRFDIKHRSSVLGTTASSRRRPSGCGHRARSGRPAGTGQWPVKRASRRSRKMRSPSAASWLRMMPGSSDAIQSRAASGPRPSPARAGQGGLHAQRGLLGDKMRQVCGPLDVRPCGHHLLHQSDPQCLGRAELLGGEQEAHRVAPAGKRSSMITVSFARVNDERDWAPGLRPDRVPSPGAGTRIRAVGPHG